MNWTEQFGGARRVAWVLVTCMAAGCSGPRDGAGQNGARPASQVPEVAQRGPDAVADARRAEETRVLGDQWASLAAVLPDEAAAVRNRLDAPRGRPGAGVDAGVDLDAARLGLRRCESLWSKAQAAFAAGNMNEAVGTAITVKAQLDGLATTLRVDVAARGG